MTPPMAFPDAMFLDYAARIKADVSVPVIAVGRLGDPETAKAAVDDGKADFVALGRSLLADPDWVKKVEGGQAIRRCLACNTCINEMRDGNQLECLVNPVTGHETEYTGAARPQGERICVVGAGPAGLSYAYLVAAANRVTVVERDADPGGAFRLAGKAHLFQEVEAREESFARYIADMVQACREKGVAFRHGVDVARAPEVLADFDRVVFATGARYRHGLGAVVPGLLDAGWGRLGPVKRLFRSPRLRNCFYYSARHATGEGMKRLARSGQTVTVIGDAASAGKCKEAIADAYRAALQ